MKLLGYISRNFIQSNNKEKGAKSDYFLVMYFGRGIIFLYSTPPLDKVCA